MDMGHGFFLCILLWTTTGVGQLATARDLGHFCYPSNYGWSENGAHGTPRIPLVDDQFPNIFTMKKRPFCCWPPEGDPSPGCRPRSISPKPDFFFLNSASAVGASWFLGAAAPQMIGAAPEKPRFCFFWGGC